MELSFLINLILLGLRAESFPKLDIYGAGGRDRGSRRDEVSTFQLGG